MLPDSQKGEETAQILSTAIVVVALATRGSLAMIAFTNGNETGRDSTRRASLPCARVKTVYTASYISGSWMVIEIRKPSTEIPAWIILP